MQKPPLGRLRGPRRGVGVLFCTPILRLVGREGYKFLREITAVTYVYVDGFNLYFSAIKGRKLHWLNLRQLCETLLPGHNIAMIHYFTAVVGGTVDDPDKATRQQLYLRALRTLPNLSITFGHFRMDKTWMPLVNPRAEHPDWVYVRKSVEKGSDVNLAAQLVHDAHRGLFDTAVLISNDSDLTAPLRIVSKELGKSTGLIYPARSRASKQLMAQSDFQKQLRDGVMRDCQFPQVMHDAKGRFENPYASRY